MQSKEIFQMSPYAMSQRDKEHFLLQELNPLTQHHLDHCEAYRKLFQSLTLRYPPYETLSVIPYLPVGLFKTIDLMSVSRNEIYKTLLSSGTTGGTPSRVYLDRATAQAQTAALAAIMTHFLGPRRLPMLIVDREDVIQDPKMFSARGAATVGMLNFGLDPFYLMDSQQHVRDKELNLWLDKHRKGPIMIFGFTYKVWNYLIQANYPEAILIHTGGWKKMEDESVTPAEFKQRVAEVLGIHRCHNFYGMIEQVGSVFMECEHGRLHSPLFADVVVRDPVTWKELSTPRIVGLLQVLSMLPHSYPGHSLLTEDLGMLLGVDDCPCGRLGKTFEVKGRVPQAELRGCSDVGGSQ